MKVSEGKTGRIFIIRLEDGDKMPEAIEQFAIKNNVSHGMCILVGGIKSDGKIIIGPEEDDALPVVPMLHQLSGVHEVAGVGTLAPDEQGKPTLHMHAALGREGETRTGCIRPGIEVWKLGEVILLEITDNSAKRVADPKTEINLLEP